MPSTRLSIERSQPRSSGRLGASVKPQLPVSSVVTPCHDAGDAVGSQFELCVVVRVDVDEPGRDEQPVGVDRLRRAVVDASDGRDRAVGDRDVGGARRRAGAVDDACRP